MNLIAAIIFAMTLLYAFPATAQDSPIISFGLANDKPESRALVDPESGPVIEGFGDAYPVPEGAWNLSSRKRYKALMDVSDTGAFEMALNPSLDRAARYLNAHAQNGIKADRMELAVVFHGEATKDLLTDDAYREEFGVLNPNTSLLEKLAGAGVKVYVCGQSMAHRGFSEELLNEDVTIAVSAMTAHVRLQEEGFNLIPF